MTRYFDSVSSSKIQKKLSDVAQFVNFSQLSGAPL